MTGSTFNGIQNGDNGMGELLPQIRTQLSHIGRGSNRKCQLIYIPLYTVYQVKGDTRQQR